MTIPLLFALLGCGDVIPLGLPCPAESGSVTGDRAGDLSISALFPDGMLLGKIEALRPDGSAQAVTVHALPIGEFTRIDSTCEDGWSNTILQVDADVELISDDGLFRAQLAAAIELQGPDPGLLDLHDNLDPGEPWSLESPDAAGIGGSVQIGQGEVVLSVGGSQTDFYLGRIEAGLPSEPPYNTCSAQLSPGIREVGDRSFDALFPSGTLVTELDTIGPDGQPTTVLLTATLAGLTSRVDLFDCPGQVPNQSMLRVVAAIELSTADGSFQTGWTGPIDFEVADPSQLQARASLPYQEQWALPGAVQGELPHIYIALSDGGMELNSCAKEFQYACAPIYSRPN